MARTRIKICGITTQEAAMAAAAAGADAIGLVFEPKSPRFIELKQAKAIVASLPAFVEPVGLFVDRSAREIREIATATGLTAVQLSGHEVPALLEDLKGFRVVKALGFDADSLPAALGAWRAVSNDLVGVQIDAPPSLSPEGLLGGSGQTFAWSDLRAAVDDGLFESLPPMILAGGLNPANVGQAIDMTRPYAVDVSSGVEASRGVKDIGRIAAFCRAVREADAR